MDINNVWDVTNTRAGDGRTCSYLQSPLFIFIMSILFTKKIWFFLPHGNPFSDQFFKCRTLLYIYLRFKKSKPPTLFLLIFQNDAIWISDQEDPQRGWFFVSTVRIILSRFSFQCGIWRIILKNADLIIPTACIVSNSFFYWMFGLPCNNTGAQTQRHVLEGGAW